MILTHIQAGKEAVMHTQTAYALLTEAGHVHFVECDECGPLGMTTDATDFMLAHCREYVS